MPSPPQPAGALPEVAADAPQAYECRVCGQRDLRWLGAASPQELAPGSEPQGGLGPLTPGPP